MDMNPSPVDPDLLFLALSNWVVAHYTPGDIDVLDADCFNQVKSHGDPLFTENTYQDMDGNMVSTPVMLAAVMATMAAVSWIDDEPAMSDTGQAHGDADADSSSSDSSSSSSSSSTQANRMSAADKEPTGHIESQPQPTTLRGCLLRRVLHDPAQRCLEATGQAHGDTGHAHGDF